MKHINRARQRSLLWFLITLDVNGNWTNNDIMRIWGFVDL